MADERDEPMEADEESYLDPARPRTRQGFDAAALREPVTALRVRRPIVMRPDETVSAAMRAMQRGHRGCVLVTEDGTPDTRLIGIFTERDVLFRIIEGGRNPATLPLEDVMTPEPEGLPEEATVAWALNKMSVGGYRHVPVVDEKGRPVFVASVRDVVDFLVQAFPREILALPPEYGADRPRSREGA